MISEEKSEKEFVVDIEFIRGIRSLGYRRSGEMNGGFNEEALIERLREIQHEEELVSLYDHAKIRISEGCVINGRTELTGRDRHLRKAVRERYHFDHTIDPESVKDTDLTHTIASLEYLLAICGGEGFSNEEMRVGVASMIVHDCAYPLVGSYDEFTQKDMRKRHMYNAAETFDEWSGTIGGFGIEEVRKIKNLVSQHDNPGFGEDFEYEGITRPLIAHREADRLWMLDCGGFALDLLREMIEKETYDPRARLTYVIKDHINEASVYQGNEELRGLCKEYKGQKILYRTKTGFQIFLNLLNQVSLNYHLDFP